MTRLSALPVGLALFAAPACIVPSISTGSDDAGPPSSSRDAGATSAAPAVKGASCTPVTASISLCEYISACPSLSLGGPVFPTCGFRIHGSAIDPECLCMNEYLCPIGSPTTCTEAAQAMSGDTNYDSVCQQALTGHCQDLAATSSGSQGSTACQTCVSNC